MNGRNIWRNDLQASLDVLKEVQARLEDRLWVAPSCSLSHRHSAFPVRTKKQQALLNLPLFPTTTIGSFPQTDNIRQTRRDFKQGVRVIVEG